MNILLLNNNPAVSRLISLSVEKLGFNLKEITSIDGYDGSKCDVIFVDSDDFNDEIINSLRNMQLCQHICLVAPRGTAKPANVNSLLEKPFLPTDFIQMIEGINAELFPHLAKEQEPSEDINELQREEELKNSEVLGTLDEDLKPSFDEIDQMLNEEKPTEFAPLGEEENSIEELAEPEFEELSELEETSIEELSEPEVKEEQEDLISIEEQSAPEMTKDLQNEEEAKLNSLEEISQGQEEDTQALDTEKGILDSEDISEVKNLLEEDENTAELSEESELSLDDLGDFDAEQSLEEIASEEDIQIPSEEVQETQENEESEEQSQTDDEGLEEETVEDFSSQSTDDEGLEEVDEDEEEFEQIMADLDTKTPILEDDPLLNIRPQTNEEDEEESLKEAEDALEQVKDEILADDQNEEEEFIEVLATKEKTQERQEQEEVFDGNAEIEEETQEETEEEVHEEIQEEQEEIQEELEDISEEAQDEEDVKDEKCEDEPLQEQEEVFDGNEDEFASLNENALLQALGEDTHEEEISQEQEEVFDGNEEAHEAQDEDVKDEEHEELKAELEEQISQSLSENLSNAKYKDILKDMKINISISFEDK